ncbi:MAG: efflux transporter outer membrane subunit [Desulfovibrionaceae bacterium]
MKNIALLFIILFMYNACSLAPRYEQPKLELPNSWAELDSSEQEYSGALWWKRFQDERLDAFVEEAIKNNQDMVIAAARVEQARAKWGIEKSNMFPTISSSISADYGQQGLSNKKVEVQQYKASVGLQYEIDFWGKYYNLSKIGKAQFISETANQEVVRLTLIANVVTTYFDIVALEKQITFLKQSVDALEKQLQVKEQEVQYGVAIPLEVTQIKSEFFAIKAQQKQLEASLIDATTSFVLLLGKSPREMIVSKISLVDAKWDNNIITSVPAGIPANILLRRLDIYQAEQSLIIANANIGVVRASYFPAISLTGVFGILSGDISKLFDNTMMWDAGLASNAPIFAFGRIVNQNKVAKAQKKEAIASYILTVQKAYKDVIFSLAILQQSAQILDASLLETKSFREAYSLAEERYSAGQLNYYEFLSTLKDLVASENRLITSQREQLLSVVQVFRSLGGDWESPDEEQHNEEKKKEQEKANGLALREES